MQKFVKGEAYWAIPALEGAERRLVCCMGIEGRTVVFADVTDAYTSKVQAFGFMGGEQHEMCQLLAADGEYHVSASAPVAFRDAAMMLQAMRSRR